MLTKNTIACFLFLCAFTFWGCHKDSDFDEEQNNVVTTVLTTPVVYEEVNANVIGLVVDENNMPVEDVEISYYNGIALTDINGVFNFDNHLMDRQGTFFKAFKAGFNPGMNKIFPDGGLSFMKIRIQRITSETVENSNSNFTVSDNGASVVISANTLQKNSETYLGEVTPNLSYHHSKEYALSQSYGGFMGSTIAGRTQVLAISGILDVRLLDTEGAALNLQTGENAQISFPLGEGGDHPDQLLLWKFNEQNGLWEEKGVASKQSDTYRAEISELGIWTIGLGYDLAQTKGQVFINEDPAIHELVRVSVDGRTCFIGYTEDSGTINAKLPADVLLDIDVINEQCSVDLQTSSIGPLADLETFDNITVTKTIGTVQGTVFCQSNFISGALLKLDIGNYSKLIYSDKEGQFRFDRDILSCASQSTKSIIIIGQDGAEDVIIDLDEQNLDNDLILETCQLNCTLFGEINYTKFDRCTTGNYDQAIVEAGGGTENYSYQWDNGATEKIIPNVLTTGELCVTVTDNDSQCSLVICEDVQIYEAYNIDDSEIGNLGCASNGGFINLNSKGGGGPFSFFWTGPNGTFSGGDQLENLIPGEYSVITQDANECSISKSFTLYDPNVPLDFEIIQNCDFSEILVDPGNPIDHEIMWSNGQSGDIVTAFEPGEYCVDVVDDYGCLRQGCVTLNATGIDPILTAITGCSEDRFLLDNNNGNIQFTFEDIFTNEMTTPSNGAVETEFNIFETGLTINMSILNLTNGCSYTQQLTLPQFTGLRIEDSNDTTCDDCDDGSIVYSLDSEGICISCDVSDVIVLESNTKQDYTIENDNTALPKGTYDVVVRSTSECYVAFERVTIE